MVDKRPSKIPALVDFSLKLIPPGAFHSGRLVLERVGLSPESLASKANFPSAGALGVEFTSLLTPH